MYVLERILENCRIDIPNAATLSPEEFALARRNGVGASDSAAILGLMEPFRTREMVMKNKLETEYTDEERAIGLKRNVRVGNMIEPLGLLEAQRILDTEVVKPTDQYRLVESPWLTVNYDGVAQALGDYCPVEIKYCSPYAEKYWKFNVDQTQPMYINAVSAIADNEYIRNVAAYHGIPSYYLVQVHHQMLGLGSMFGKLLALRDKDWDWYMFHIPRYESIIKAILVGTHSFAQQLESIRPSALKDSSVDHDNASSATL